MANFNETVLEMLDRWIQLPKPANRSQGEHNGRISAFQHMRNVLPTYYPEVVGPRDKRKGRAKKSTPAPEPIIPKGVYLGTALAADFDRSTLTLHMERGFAVLSGRYALVPDGSQYPQDRLKAVLLDLERARDTSAEGADEFLFTALNNAIIDLKKII